jgi:hypothetical protein
VTATGVPHREEFRRGRLRKAGRGRGPAQARIVASTCTDDAAFAKIELDYPKVKFTDYFTLLKVDGEWKIMSKVYHGQPKP